MMKNNKISLALSFLLTGALALSCAKSSDSAADAGGGSTTLSTTCETTFDASSLNMQKLCTPEAGTGRHFRLEGARLITPNSALYLYLGGYASGLESGATAPMTDPGKMRVLLYEGLSQPSVQYGSTTSVATTIANAAYKSAATAVCLDVTAGSPARVTLWISGANGADCSNKSTLTIATALLDKSDWTETSALASGVNYVRTSGAATDATITKVVVSSELALSASTCESTPGTGFSEVCKPTAGVSKHYRLEGVQTSVAHTTAAIILGAASQPSSANDATTSGQAKLLFYHGNGGAPAPQSNVDFSAQSTTPTYTAYTTAAQTICFDITADSPPRITAWATGTNSADCADRTTLTAANSFANKNDWTTAVALTDAKVFYYRGTSVTTTKVTAYTTTFGSGF